MAMLCASRVSTTAATAGDAGDDDAEEGGDGVDYALKDGSNAVDNSHDAVPDGAEHSLDLKILSVAEANKATE